MTTYIVQPGDTLGRIAYQFFGTYAKWPLLAKYNDLVRPDLIEVGQEIEVPPWEPRRFCFPMAEKDTPYLKFGQPYGPGFYKGRPHPGVDFHEADGARVYAVGDGKVRVRKGDPRGYGFYTMIEHRLPDGGPVWTLYAHLSTPAVYPVGDWIGQGAVVGWEGDTGNSGGLPHLHFEVKRTPDLALYDRLSLETLNQFWHDPCVFLSTALFVPVQCWGCPRCN